MSVDLPARVKEITLRELPMVCLPTVEGTNQLARSMEKLRRQGVAKPFPVVSLASFLPTWAKVRPGVEDADGGEALKVEKVSPPIAAALLHFHTGTAMPC